MVCERCNEIVGPEDSFCPSCGACIKVDKCRRGRIALTAMFVILVGYPLLRSIYSIGATALKGEPVGVMPFVDTFLLVALGFLFYRAFRGDERVRIPIAYFLILLGAFRILVAFLISLLLQPVSSLLGWLVTGIVEIGFGIFFSKSMDIKAHIVSRTERNKFGR